MDPTMMQQEAPPMDPTMMQQGAPPVDPSMQQAAPQPPTILPEQLDEMMTLLEDMAGGLQDVMQRIDGLEQQNQQQAQQIDELTTALQGALQAPPEAAQPQGGW